MMVNGHAIYGIFNAINCDYYIGSAVNFLSRKYIHQHNLRKNKHDSPILQNSWNKYGENAFSFEIIEIIKNRSDLIQREQFWIDFLKPRFNCSPIAGSPLGVKHTKQSRKNMSDAHKGIVLKKDGGHKKNCQCACCGNQSGSNHPNYIEREERACACGCGNIFTCMINSKKKFISGHNSFKDIERKNKRQKYGYSKFDIKGEIMQFTLDNLFIQTHKNASTAAYSINVLTSRITDCINGKNKSAAGFKWRYKND